MVIVAGYLLVEPEQRSGYLADASSVVEAARRAPGCLDFFLGADLLDPARIAVFERWETRQAVEAFRGDGPSDEQATAILGGSSVSEYDVTGVRPLL